MNGTKQRERDGQFLIKCGSGRARNKLLQLLGRKPDGYFSFRRDTSKGVYAVTASELKLAKAAKIKGLTQTHWSDDLGRTWSM